MDIYKHGFKLKLFDSIRHSATIMQWFQDSHSHSQSTMSFQIVITVEVLIKLFLLVIKCITYRKSMATGTFIIVFSISTLSKYSSDIFSQWNHKWIQFQNCRICQMVHYCAKPSTRETKRWKNAKYFLPKKKCGVRVTPNLFKAPSSQFNRQYMACRNVT